MLSLLLAHLFFLKKSGSAIETITKMEFTMEGRNTDAAQK